MTKKLDRAKPYAQLYGASIARFEQDGVQFDQDGNEIGAAASEAVAAPAGSAGDDSPDIEQWSMNRLRQEIKRLQGKGPQPNSTHRELVDRVRALHNDRPGA